MGIFDSLLGGSSGAGYTSRYRKNQADALGQIGNQANDYAAIKRRGASQVAAYDPEYNRAIGEQATRLRTDPYTQGVTASHLAGALAGASSAYDTAKSNIDADLNRRGISGGVAAGALASVDSAQAGQIAAAKNALAMKRADSADSRGNALVSLFAQARGLGAQEEQRGLSGEAGTYNTLYSGYGNMASEDEAAEARRQQERLQRQQAVIGALGSVGSLAGMFLPGAK